jgi:hypothetical protein
MQAIPNHQIPLPELLDMPLAFQWSVLIAGLFRVLTHTYLLSYSMHRVLNCIRAMEWPGTSEHCQGN